VLGDRSDRRVRRLGHARGAAFLPEILPAVEIGWRLPREHWGHGYATEAAAELLRFGLTAAGLDRVVSIRGIGNARSGRVMDKLGLRFEFTTTVPASRRACPAAPRTDRCRRTASRVPGYGSVSSSARSAPMRRRSRPAAAR
jgi:hypothetical protein